MSEKSNRVLSAFLATLLLFSTFSAVAFAEEPTSTFILGQGFESLNVGDTGTEVVASGIMDGTWGSTVEITDNTLGAGNALEITATGGQITSYYYLDYDRAANAGAEAVVIRMKTPAVVAPETTLQTHFMVQEGVAGDPAGWSEMWRFKYPAELTAEAGSITLVDAATLQYTNINMTTPNVLPGNFDGWVIVPKSYFTLHTTGGPIENSIFDLNLAKIVMIQMDAPVIGEKYVVDSVGFTANTAGFLNDLGATLKPSTFILGQGFESLTVGNTGTEVVASGIMDGTWGSTVEITDNTLGAGNALEITATGGQITSYYYLDYDRAANAGAEAVVIRMKTPAVVAPDTTLQTHFLVQEGVAGDPAGWSEMWRFKYPAELTAEAGSITLVDAATLQYTNINMTTPNVLPGNFDGWVIVPKSYFTLHTTGGPIENSIFDLNLAKIVMIQMDTPVIGEKYVVDSVGFTADTAGFLDGLGATLKPNFILGQGFESFNVGDTGTEVVASGIMDGTWGSTVAITDNTLGAGNALEITATGGQITSYYYLDYDRSANAGAEAVVIRMKTPDVVAPNTSLFTHFLVQEGVAGDPAGWSEMWRFKYPAELTAEPGSITLVDAATLQYKNINLTTPNVLPGNFDGWVIIPKSYFTLHTTGGPIENSIFDLNLAKIVMIQMDTPVIGEKYVVDSVGFTDNTAGFLDDLGAVEAYDVKFLDFNGNTIKTQNVLRGGAASAPADPSRSGYIFTGWDKTFNNITADTIVTAQYVHISQLTGLDIPGSSVVGNIPVGSSDTIYAPTVFVNIPSTTTSVTAANLLTAGTETVELYSSIEFSVEDMIESKAIDSNSVTVFAKITSEDLTIVKYYRIVLNVVDSSTKYAITAPAAFTKVGANYKATIEIDRVRATKLADPKLYVIYTFADGVTQSFQTLDISLSDTTATKDIVVTSGIISVQVFLVDGIVDWSIGSPTLKSNFIDIVQ